MRKMMPFQQQGQEPEKKPENPSEKLPEKSSEDDEHHNPPPPFIRPVMQQILILIAMGFMIYMMLGDIQSSAHNIPYSTFKDAVRHSEVSEVSIKNNLVTGKYFSNVYSANSAGTNYERFVTRIPSFGDPNLLTDLEDGKVTVNIVDDSSSQWLVTLLSFLPLLLIFGFIYYSQRGMSGGMGGRLSGFGQSKARKLSSDESTTRLSDVAGLENAKQELQEIIDYLRSPEEFRRLGAKMPKGILMMGPPGCGKTLLAKAIAGEAGVDFFSVSGSEFVEMFVGVGASRVRSMFEEARKVAPSLIFIDEIDAVGRARGAGLGGGNDEREQTLNQILSEMDGFSSDEPVVVLAATNRPDVLDPALLRPGRFDRKLVLELPQRQAREAILKVHARRSPIADDVDLTHIAGETVGFSGADLQNLVNEAALRAVRKHKTQVTAEDFEKARDRIILGSESRELLNPGERKRIAYHEAGHALIAWLLPNADPLKRITIIPHGRALGATEQMPEEDRHNYTEDYLKDMLKIFLGGRCAEMLAFDGVSSGAADDLKKATDIARKMVSQWGMNDSLGPVSFPTEEEHPFLGRDISVAKKFSEQSAEYIDKEVRQLIIESEENSLKLLNDHRDQLDRLAEFLLKNETVHEEDLPELLAPDEDASQSTPVEEAGVAKSEE